MPVYLNWSLLINISRYLYISMKILKIVFSVIAVLILLTLAGTYIYLKNLSPQYSGEIELQGLQSQVKVFHDEYGIPHIYAQNEEDTYLALGYLHAQERLFQMEFLRRLGSGKLAAVFGQELVLTDRFFRTIGLEKMAERAVTKNHTNTATRYHKAAVSYLKGINQFIEKGATPVEFTLLGIQKNKFSLKDFYVISGYMSYSFSGGFTTDPLVNYIYEILGEEYLKDLANSWPEENVRIPVKENKRSTYNNHLKIQYKMATTLEKFPLPKFQGSNAWVLAPSKTATGNVLFENDPHIQYSQPSTWYEAHLEYPGQSFYGSFLAGFPFALIGHNRHVSWGFTMFLNDDLDLYREHVNPDNPDQVWVNDRWEELNSREEKIEVKGEEDVIFKVKESRHGPMLNYILGSDEKLRELDSAEVSLWWTYHKFTSRHLELTYKMSHAKNKATFRSIISDIHAPGLNVMYGDAEGNIAWWAAAKLVKRPGHVNSKLLLDGASGKDEPLGFHDFSENPMSENPASGFVYSANNQPEAVNGKLYTGYYTPDNRARRIEQLLSAKDDWTLEDLKKMVLDDISITDRDLAGEMVKIIEKNKTGELSENQSSALKYLKTWNGSHKADHVAPALYYRWLTKILRLSMQDELGKENYDLLTTTLLLKKSYPALIQNENSVWWDNISTKINEDRGSIIFKAFQETVEAFERASGEDPANWTWGKKNKLVHEHVVGRKKPLDRIFNVGPFSVSGGQEVIDNKDFHLKDQETINITHGPSMRMLVDFSDIENSYNINPTGQSGFFMSPHYQDQTEIYNNGHFRKMMMNREEILRKSRKLLFKPSE